MKLNYKTQNIFTRIGLVIASVAVAATITGRISTGVGDNGGVFGVVVTTPSASPVAETYTANQSVTLAATGSNSIHYTTDGTTPTCTTGSTYSSAISVTSTTTIKALACYANNNASSVLSSLYTLQCSTNSVSNGSVAAYPTCTITCNSGYSLSGSTCVSSGGGSGGGGFSPGASSTTTTTTITDNTVDINSLRALVAQLQARIAAIIAGRQSSSASNGGSVVASSSASNSFSLTSSFGSSTNSTSFASGYGSGFVFGNDLQLGSVGEDVKRLQVYLNNHGFKVALTGPGSPNNETTKFGLGTQKALKLFQKSVNISASGFFGPTTRAYVNSH